MQARQQPCRDVASQTTYIFSNKSDLAAVELAGDARAPLLRLPLLSRGAKCAQSPAQRPLHTCLEISPGRRLPLPESTRATGAAGLAAGPRAFLAASCCFSL